ncbi:MAG: hypothetical protein R2883_02155 [Caldisericia bacterium]
MFDAIFIGKPIFVEIVDEEKKQERIFRCGDAGYFGERQFSDKHFVVEEDLEKTTCSFVQVNESSVWSKRMDKVNIHQNWQMSFASKDFHLLPTRFDNLIEADVVILDMGTTFVSQEDMESLENCVESGGNLLIYENDTRFKDFGGTLIPLWKVKSLQKILV